jgi:hypothetical protein
MNSIVSRKINTMKTAAMIFCRTSNSVRFAACSIAFAPGRSVRRSIMIATRASP